MSSDSLAAFRRNSSSDAFAKLAEEHMQHDLQPADREALTSAAKSVFIFSAIGSGLGLALGLVSAQRVRAARTAAYSAFRHQEKPTHVVFADGRQEAIPDVSKMMKPSTFGAVATNIFFAAGGLFLGGELGLLAGSWRAKSLINSDPASRARIEKGMRNLQADVLRKQADLVEKGQGETHL